MDDDPNISTPFITTMQKIPLLTINPLNLHLPDQPEKFLAPVMEKENEIDTEENNLSFKEIKNEMNQSNSNVKWYKIMKFDEVPDKVVPPRALAVLPLNLQYKSEVISPIHTLNVYSKLGPVQGINKKIAPEETKRKVIESAQNLQPIYLLKNMIDKSIFHIDVSDHDKSNWIAFLKLGNKHNANVWLHQFENDLYLVTVEAIPARRPLLVGYSKEYAMLHGIPDSQPVLDLEEIFKNVNHIKCSKPINDFNKSERHHELHDTKLEPNTRSYKCKYCFKNFSRMYCMKRHIQGCTKKLSKENTPESSKNTSTDKQTDLSIMDMEDRLPSDESFQNFTNILDFSTNLFDTERIPSLDISSSSKSNDDTWRYDNEESFGLTQGNIEKADVKKTPTKKTSSPFSCSYCKKSISRTKIRYHARTCTARRFECQCGRVFRSKEKLAIHAFTVHRVTDAPKEKLENKPSATHVPYICTYCNLIFKRRGMLVNHLSRSHDASPSSVPLVVQDIRFPCPVCPKLYRTAAKRDLHVRAHHPGTKYARSHTIVGGFKTKQPSVCWVCPKEYATRAKMLQHVRRHHPDYRPKDQVSPTEVKPRTRRKITTEEKVT